MLQSSFDSQVTQRQDNASLLQDAALARFVMDIRALGVRRTGVIAAFEEMHRRVFLHPNLKDLAYASFPLPLDCGEEATPPLLVAQIIAAADPTGTERILEIGTGSGFQTAILSRLARMVVSVERWRTLADQAARTLGRIAIRNVELRHADGLALEAMEPFDLILINGTLPVIPAQLMTFLKPNGRIFACLPVAGKQNALHCIRHQTVDILFNTDLAPIKPGLSRAI